MITFLLIVPMMIIFVLAGAACGFFVMHQKLTTVRLPERTEFQPVLKGEFNWFMAPVIVGGTFAAISLFDFSQVTGTDRPRSASGFTQSRKRSISETDPVTRVSVHTDQQRRPEWLDLPTIQDGLSERRVISSQQFSTIEEAEQELQAKANQILRDDLARLFPGESAVSPWNPSLELLKQHTVKEQYAEVVERDFGSFVHPMYRVWWQIELSPEVRVEFLPIWKKGLTSARIRTVSIVVTSAVLVISLMAFYYRTSLLQTGSTLRRLWLMPVIGLAALILIKFFRSI